MKTISKLGIAFLFVAGMPAWGGATQEQIDSLGGAKYTPVGAERAGNADGSIPEWTGGLKESPAGYKEGDKLMDPFPDDKPLFTITAANADQYKDNLSPGQIAMLKRYPDTFSMPVYQSRRTAAYPEHVYKEIKDFAAQSEMVDGGNGLKKQTATVPFPFPDNGLEVIWNHILRYRGDASFLRKYTQIPVQANGNFSPVLFEEKATRGQHMYDKNSNIIFLFLQKILAPPRLEGDILLVHETLNQKLEPRKAWVYNAGQRRVRKAPDVAYDGPGTASDGLRTADDLDLYNGSPDRYNWTLVGKKELYIPYNAFRVMQGDLKYKDIVKPGHLDPQYLRYEKHRVWVVDAKLKDGARHIYARRTFYVDEDTYQISVVDHYDGRGELWKLKEGHKIQHHHVQVPWLAVETNYDILSGRYLVTGLDNEERGYQYDFEFKASERDYNPSGLRRAARR